MTDAASQDAINAILWKVCDIFRGEMNTPEYKNYILVMLFVKYISDVWIDPDERNQSYDDAERPTRPDRFILPVGSDFYSLYEKRYSPNLGSEINRALYAIEQANIEKLAGIATTVDFSRIGFSRRSNELLTRLLEEFNNPLLDMRPSHMSDLTVIGRAFDFLISLAPSEHLSGGGEFYTPDAVGLLMTKILKPIPGESICDPTCGSGSLLIKCLQEINGDDCVLYGQERQIDAWGICLLNLILHGAKLQEKGVKLGDTLRDPLQENGQLRQFDAVIANPPIGMHWDSHEAYLDQFKRFQRGVPPSSRADFAFILHIIESLKTDGRAVVLVPHSVLFREGIEGDIRRRIIEENLIEAVIGLPSNLLYGTSTATAILVINKQKSDRSILFIDGSKEFGKNRTQAFLRTEDIEKVLTTFRENKNIPNYATVASYGDIVENDYNLNVARYTFSAPPIDTTAIKSTCSKRYDVFVSYSRKNLGHMKTVSEKLREFGLNVWTDENLEVGTANWQAEIANALDNCCTIVCLLSPEAKVSEWVLKEINYARVHRVKIFPVLVSGTIETSVPLVLIDAQYIDLQSQFDEAMQNLNTAIYSYTGVRSSSPPYVYNLNEIASKQKWAVVDLETVIDFPKKLRLQENSDNETYPRYSPSGEILDYVDHYEYDGEFLLVTRVSSNLKDRNGQIAYKRSGKFSATPNVHVLTAKNGNSIDYLVLALAVTDLRQYINDATIPSLSKSSLNKIKILLPDPDEQIRIASYVEEELGEINAFKDKLRKQISFWDANAVDIVRRIFSEGV